MTQNLAHLIDHFTQRATPLFLVSVEPHKAEDVIGRLDLHRKDWLALHHGFAVHVVSDAIDLPNHSKTLVSRLPPAAIEAFADLATAGTRFSEGWAQLAAGGTAA